MWCFRRMNRISWKQMKMNEKVLSSCKCQRSLLKKIRTRQLKFLSHIVRKQGLENLALTGKIAGKRNRGRHECRLCSNFKESQTTSFKRQTQMEDVLKSSRQCLEQARQLRKEGYTLKSSNFSYSYSTSQI